MKRTKLIIFFSSLALLFVLFLQVNGILQTANAKEQLFNEKANMVLARTTEALLDDKQMTEKMQGCMGKKENRTIDSLFQHYMNFYSFHIDYRFEVVQPPADRFLNESGYMNGLASNQQACYEKSLDEVANKSGLQLKLIFPEKSEFIIAELGIHFIASVILILIVIILFWKTSLSLLREKKIAEHTSDFLNNMTHEFKTPLTNISLAGKMMMKDKSSEEKVKHYAGIIIQENDKLRSQVDQVLNMTVLEKGQIQLQKLEVDIHQLINDAVRNMTLQLENRSAELKLELNAHRVLVLGDRTHLMSAFCNLIDNAIKYSNEVPKLKIQSNDSGNWIEIRVVDHGPGIPIEFQEKVFEKFFRIPTGDRHDVKGFGLGLAYVKRIIDLHGGSIALESGKGITTFTILLPRA